MKFSIFNNELGAVNLHRECTLHASFAYNCTFCSMFMFTVLCSCDVCILVPLQQYFLLVFYIGVSVAYLTTGYSKSAQYVHFVNLVAYDCINSCSTVE